MRYIILILCFSLFTGCRYFRGDDCNNTKPVIGVYKNVHDKQATNLLFIKEDGTYIQKFTKNGITKENTGTWEFFKESCNLKLNNLKLMQKVSPTYSKYFTQTGIYRINTIRFNEDLRKEFDFYRVE